jgi:copper(I)-binding protein
VATAAYFAITNGGSAPDRLVGVRTPVAEVVEIHETVLTDGMMGMRPVASVTIPAGGTVAMAPGGTHVMLIGLTGELRAGSSFQITLTFERAGTVVATVGVRGS